ncbi:dihydrolipoamide acetyltransferase family protein [Sphingomonas sp.]|jgi:2-oxoisovalerate dehydrogenase E2 component (dihydrolipoyl transacylase)|uniref:dihydrolipoamide acetyltransferase family protein n=1 Tax=Sphingomonas sp. TaxID=28214 RepID=UPI002E382166|nr:dihydrolipoamide acetyltransferase family protein [Sphingomonas sp.]HEX4695767.1 dihydrolipoamide acetyltransferase family protein [Sphingomonas sp.]
MARFEFRLPDIGEGIAEAEIVAWHVKVGDSVEEDQQLADMMTDKATVEMESPVAGTVLELAGEVGDQVPIGSTLVVIETAGEATIAPSEETVADGAPGELPANEAKIEEVEETIEAENPGVADAEGKTPAYETPSAPAKAGALAAEAVPSPQLRPSPEHNKAVLASPAVRQRASELGVDLSQVKADGDRIRHADLDAFLRYGSGQGYHAPHASRARDDETIKVIGMRRRIAENMAASKRNIPHFTYIDEIDVTALEEVRADLNANRGGRPKLTMLPFVIAAICRSLPEFPMLNARYDDEAGVVTRSGRVHLGMATQTDAGLTVPVIRDAQDKNVWQLATEIGRLAEAARANKLKPDEMGGGTITVTSLGPLGGIATTPVINRPEVAIIGPNKIVERPIFRGDDIIRAKLMNLSISCDHRVVDGWDAASYVQHLKKFLETPVLLFTD